MATSLFSPSPPADTIHPNGPRARDSSSSSSSRRPLVLVVEDEELLRAALERILAARGYDVAVAGDGHEALRCLDAEALPDLIVFDLRMPVMNGWEFRAIQKDDPRLGLIPVLVISADTSAQALAISAHGFLTKPFGAEEIL